MGVERGANGMGWDSRVRVEEAGNRGEIWERLWEHNGKRQWEYVGHAQRNLGGTRPQIRSRGI